MTENLILIPEGQCESEALIKECDVLIKVGGGPQSEKELQMAVEAGLLTVEVTTDF
jgi:phosphoribosylformimino-5-aminoimidazole carboxamide ribonucleotide (ProFAR) isomerase